MPNSAALGLSCSLRARHPTFGHGPAPRSPAQPAVPGNLDTRGASVHGRGCRARRFCSSGKLVMVPYAARRNQSRFLGGTEHMQTNHIADTATIKITANDRGNPPGKLADVEVHFVGSSVFAGLKLIGFSIWERRGGSGRNVTFPARQYTVNGERRSFALLRPIVDVTAQEKIRALILEAFQDYEERAAIPG